MTSLSRRQFVLGTGAAGLGLLSGCGRWPGQAQQPKVPRIGLLSLAVSATSPNAGAFREGLRELGYVDGQNIAIEYRWPDGNSDELPMLATELVQLPVDVIVAASTPANLAAKQATSTIPIVMAVVGDPVGEGLIASLARPGGNITGLSMLSTTLSGKRLELLKQVMPSAARVAVLWWEPTDPGSARAYSETETAARTLRVALQPLRVQGTNWDVEGVFQGASRERADALVVLPLPLSGDQLDRFVTVAAESRLPAMYPFRHHAETGGLMAYGVNSNDLFRRAAYYVDRILKGAQPADLPVEQPMRFDFVVNLKTAAALGITFPNEILLQVTEVIDQ